MRRASPNAWLSLLLLGCGGDDPAPAAPPAPVEAPAPPTGPRPSLVLVTLDTTRADRVGAYGYAEAVTPTIDQLAQEGLRFERAYATVPLTTPSHASMFTGLYPSRHGVHTNGDAVLPEELTTLAEALQAEGWATGASVAAFVTTRIWNLDQGFDAYFDDVPAQGRAESRWSRERSADEVVDSALAWLETLPEGQPFFLWVHVYDAHHPYEPPEEALALTPGRPYDGELAFIDQQLARLRPAVEAKAGDPGAAWILVADHGEALAESRGEHTHGLFLYDETMRVPFILRPPKALDAPQVVTAPTVSGVDVAPTALGLLGLPVLREVDGIDLSPLLRGETVERDAALMESLTAAQRFGFAPERAAAQGSWKLMATPSPRLFDLSADPGEASDVYAQHPEVVAGLQAQVDADLARAVDRASEALSAEVIEQLAALGYIGAGEEADLDSSVDAKDQVHTLRALEKARMQARLPKTRDEAERAYREILAAQPGLREARVGLSRVLEESGRLAEAEALLREGGEDPSPMSRMSLARLLGKQGRADEAVQELEAALAQVPGDEQTQVALVRALWNAERGDEAVARAEAFVAESPESGPLHAQLGLMLSRSTRVAEAEAHLQTSLADGVERPYVSEGLARVALAKGDDARAVLLLETELSLFPKNPEGRRLLGGLYMDAARWSDAEAAYKTIAQHNPQDVDARRAWAQAVFNQGRYAEAEEVLAPAVQRAPEDPHVLMLQANILAKTDRRDEGQALQERARALWEAAGRPLPR